MGGKFRIRRPSPALVVSVVALVVAGIGTAVALPGHNSVRSDDIKNGQIKSGDLARSARPYWALVDGSAGEIVAQSGGAEIVEDGANFTYVDFGKNLRGRALLVTPKTNNAPDYFNATICGGPQGGPQTLTCSDHNTVRVAYVETGGDDGDFWVASLPK